MCDLTKVFKWIAEHAAGSIVRRQSLLRARKDKKAIIAHIEEDEDEELKKYLNILCVTLQLYTGLNTFNASEKIFSYMLQ